MYEKKELKELDRQELLIVVFWNKESKEEVELCNDLISYLNEQWMDREMSAEVKETGLFEKIDLVFWPKVWNYQVP